MKQLESGKGECEDLDRTVKPNGFYMYTVSATTCSDSGVIC